MIRPKLPPYQRKKSFTGGFFGKPLPPQCPHTTMSLTAALPLNTSLPELPPGTAPLENQVAGHQFQAGTDAVGILKSADDGSIMKPAGKPLCGAREIKFYETISALNLKDACLLAVRDLVPEYRGIVKMRVGGRELDFIKLSDATQGMLEPCIMDIKIGRQTWDPLASDEKIKAEESKYAICKQKLGFCIPGFQVHSVANGRVRRFGKDYGKKLNENSVKDTLRMFLNGDSGLCRALIMHFLSGLWSVQKWARTQKKYRLYSSSLLLVYDARRLRATTKRKISTTCSPTANGVSPKTSVTHQRSPTAADCHTASPEFPSTPCEEVASGNSNQIQSFRMVQRSHSTQNNYDEDVKAIRENYVFMLDSLTGAYIESKEWAFVKMIDFAHAFPNDSADTDTIDTNYLFGIENLVKIFENFLKEAETV